MFWDGIISSLNNQDYQIAGIRKQHRDFINQLKAKIKWYHLFRGKEIINRARNERTYGSYKRLYVNGIHTGHLTQLGLVSTFSLRILQLILHINI